MRIKIPLLPYEIGIETVVDPIDEKISKLDRFEGTLEEYNSKTSVRHKIMVDPEVIRIDGAYVMDSPHNPELIEFVEKGCTALIHYKKGNLFLTKPDIGVPVKPSKKKNYF